jgi:proteic killer suppression protein
VFRVISSFRHRGLEEFFKTGKSRRVSAGLRKRIKVRLDAIANATNLNDLALPGVNFHPLVGKPRRYSIHVNGPWAITFGWEDGEAVDVDLEQYH